MHLLKFGDEIELALRAAGDDESPLAKGVRLIHEGVAKTLSEMGLVRLSLLGNAFDPNVAEAVDVVPVQDEASDGKVVAEIAPGFTLGERIVRPARVRVGRYGPAQ